MCLHRYAHIRISVLALGCWGLALMAADAAPRPQVGLPLERTVYFVGEIVPLALGAADGEVTLEAVHPDGKVLLYRGAAGPLLLDTARLGPGEYALQLNGAATGQTLTLTSPLRRSAGSLQDEAVPADGPQLSREESANAAVRDEKVRAYREQLVRTLNDTRMSAVFALGAAEAGQYQVLDLLARTGTMAFVNPDTRPTSFVPPHVDPVEVNGLTQRMILIAQANARYPNFGGLCMGWDTTGYRPAGRKMLVVYWGWGQQEQALRNYLQREDQTLLDEFKRRTKLNAVTASEFIQYALSIGRPDFAPAIDLPTKLWLEEMAANMQPLPAAERQPLEQRLDAWSRYLMGLYREYYGAATQALHAVEPTMRHSGSVQIDHCPVMYGQYYPWANEPFDFRYQSTWNDQIGGPDYSYQWLFTAALLDMHRNGKPTWISNCIGAAHERAKVPGKFVRVAAHDLAYGGSGIGFALEGFSNLLGGMNAQSRWEAIAAGPGGADVLAGRDFLDRFAVLAVEGRGACGVGVLFSQSQFCRQETAMGFGHPLYRTFIALARLGYTPRFLSEDEVTGKGLQDLKALVLVGQTFPLPELVTAKLDAFVKKGGRVLLDGSSTIALPGAEKLPFGLPAATAGKPHNWGAPNMARGENDTVLLNRWLPELTAGFSRALGDTGRGLFTAELGPQTKVSVFQIDGGRDATYLVTVNDSSVHTQADWHTVTEQLVPGPGLKPGSVLYDCTREQLVGEAQAFRCDLSQTTARVYAILPRPIKHLGVAANQHVQVGDRVAAWVEFQDEAGKRLQGTFPFFLALQRPDGTRQCEFYRGTARFGVTVMELPIPLTAPVGQWTLLVRSQLTGEVASLPITVTPTLDQRGLAVPWPERVVVRDRPALDQALAGGTKMVLPLFDTPDLAELTLVADQVKTVLVAKGVAVEVRAKPTFTTYLLGYDPTPAEQAENARAEAGETIGRIKRTTVNLNDWYCGQSGYRCGVPLILLDLVGRKDNELAEALERLGALWPRVSPEFPGAGGAVIQVVPWAFAPRQPTVTIQATDVAGLLAGVRALAELPPDHLMPSVRAARTALFQEYAVGGKPELLSRYLSGTAAMPGGANLAAEGLEVKSAPEPFAIDFRGTTPIPPEQAAPVPLPPPARLEVPGLAEIGHLTPQILFGGKYLEASTPGGQWAKDMRFWQAARYFLEVKQAGKLTIAAEGRFRYSDRRPCSQGQWEELLALRERVVPAKREPMVFTVLLGEQAIGKLAAARTAEQEVPLEMGGGHGQQKPKSAVEEVVVELSGEVELPAGPCELLLIPRAVVDGRLDRVRFGVTAAEADAIAKARADAAAAKDKK